MCSFCRICLSWCRITASLCRSTLPHARLRSATGFISGRPSASGNRHHNLQRIWPALRYGRSLSGSAAQAAGSDGPASTQPVDSLPDLLWADGQEPSKIAVAQALAAEEEEEGSDDESLAPAGGSSARAEAPRPAVDWAEHGGEAQGSLGMARPPPAPARPSQSH